MKHPFRLAAALIFLSASLTAARAENSMTEAAARIVGRQFVRDLSSDKAADTIQGDKALWTDLILQKPAEAKDFASLETDLKNSDINAQLQDAGFKLLDAKKKSFAFGLRPTLIIMVLRSPSGAEGLDKGFYVVTANAVQDCIPYGGETVALTTWLKIGDPIPFSGDDLKDIAAIRASVRAGVKAFITAAQKKDEEPVEKK